MDLLADKQGSICTLTINQPQRRNVLNPSVLRRLMNQLQDLAQDGVTRVVVLCGAGEEAFSGGYDISEIPTGEEIVRENPMELATGAVEACPLPVIAMVHGFCVGGGLDLATSCDLRIAADNARFGMTPAKLGLVYNSQGILRLINLVGPSQTKELFYIGDLITAQRACQIGLVDRVVPAPDLAGETYRLAQKIAENAPLSIRGTKHAINRLLQYQQLSPEARAELLQIEKQTYDSEDRREGQRAFQEKRKPIFTGK